MPNWKEVLKEINEETKRDPNSSPFDTVRRRYLKLVSEFTGRNAIAYYSGWLQKPNQYDTFVNDKDISGFMLCIHGMDKSKGLDLILHTPGGNTAATESLVTYLYSIFNNNIRAIIPQLSMSAGTMIAFATKTILMGKHSSLGPIDPQVGGMPAEAVLNEFDKAKKEIIANPKSSGYWQFILNKYYPTFLTTCKQSIDMSKTLAHNWLTRNMCGGNKDKATKVLKKFSSHSKTKMHSRHIMIEDCIESGLCIEELEADDKLQDLILTVHHAFMHTFYRTRTVKIIENHEGTAYIETMPNVPPLPTSIQMPLPIMPKMIDH